MSEGFEKIETLADQIKEYVNTRLEQLKLSVAEKVSKAIAVIIAFFVIVLVFFLFFVLLCGAAAWVIGEWLQSIWLGFLIVSGFVFLIGIIMWLTKGRWLRKSIINQLTEVMLNMMIEVLFDNDNNNAKD